MMNVTTRTVWMTLCGAGIGLATGSCMVERRYANPNHCANQTGDDWCAVQYEDGSRPYCILGNGVCGSTPGQDGCVEVLPSNDCYSPCGSSMTVLEDGSCISEVTGDSTSTAGSTTSETDDVGSSTTGPEPCVTSDDCPDAAAPLCDPGSGECVSCGALDDGDTACESEDPGLPLCVDDACVQCTAELPGACDGETPVCDDQSNTCVPCIEHGQCGEAACNLFTGACLPADEGDVVHVGPGEEFMALADAVASFDLMAEGTIIVHAGVSYDEMITVDGGRLLAFLAAEIGAGVEPPRWIRSAGASPQLLVTDGTVLMDGIQMSGNASSMDPGLLVDGGRAWVDRGRIIDNNGGGIVAQNAAELVLRNCFVGSLGDVIGVEVVDASALVNYSTISASTFGMTPALGCTNPVTVDVRNSIIVSQGGTPPDELSCMGGTIVSSATEAEVGSFSLSWFTNYNGGEFFLTTMGMSSGADAFRDIAQWQTGDPTTDIDGDPRPMMDGTPDYAGADIPPR